MIFITSPKKGKRKNQKNDLNSQNSIISILKNKYHNFSNRDLAILSIILGIFSIIIGGLFYYIPFDTGSKDENRLILQGIEQIKIQQKENETEIIVRFLKENYGKSPEDVSRIVKEFSKSSNDFYDIGLAYSAKGNYSEAINYYDKSLLANPNQSDVLFSKGNVQVLTNQTIAALDNYNKAIDIYPQYADAWNNKGAALGNLKRNEDALTAFDKAIRINQHYADAWNNKGIVLSKLGRYEDALTAFDDAIRINPQNADAWYSKGIALGKLGRNEEAKIAFENAYKLDSKLAIPSSLANATTKY